MLPEEILSVKLLGSVAISHLMVDLCVHNEAVRVFLSQYIVAIDSLEFASTKAAGVKHIISDGDTLEGQKGTTKPATRRVNKCF